MRWLISAVTVLLLAGCGNVDWFPTGTNTSAPVAFQFTLLTNVVINTAVQSNSVTVTGDNQSGWPISVSDGTAGANSQYSINGAAFTNTAGTILPNQTLRIQQTSASTNSTLTTSNVTVGTYSTTFQSQTASQ